MSSDAKPLNISALLKPINSLEISARAIGALHNYNLQYVAHALTYNRAELLRIPNFGRKCLNEFKEAMRSLGIPYEDDSPLPAEIRDHKTKADLEKALHKILPDTALDLPLLDDGIARLLPEEIKSGLTPEFLAVVVQEINQDPEIKSLFAQLNSCVQEKARQTVFSKLGLDKLS